MYDHSSHFYQNVVIVGVGSVGTHVAIQISETQGSSAGHAHPTRIIGLVDSSALFIMEKHASLPFVIDNTTKKEELHNQLSTLGKKRTQTREYDDVLSELKNQGWSLHDVVFIDTTADKTEYSLQFHKNILAQGGKIVTANKNPLSLFGMDDFLTLTQERTTYRYSASVMAGAPGINTLQEAYDTRNKVLKIEGCFSGTLGFIASGIETRKLSEVLKEAIEKGYTEPNPWDDLNGLDVARKILILARTAGFPLSMDDISLEPFLPEEFGEYEKNTLVGAVREKLDELWTKKMTQLQSEGKTLRYVAKLHLENGRGIIRVGMQAVNKESPLGSLSGTKNKITITTENIGDQIFEQAGAGISVTAQGIINDLRALLPKITA